MFQTNTNSPTILSAADIQLLNQKWQKTVAPHVLLDSVGNDTDFSKSQKQNYPFGETIAKIEILRAQGKTLCLFVRRTPFEELPSDRDEAKENEVWVSADLLLISPEGYPVDSQGPMSLVKYQKMKKPLDIERRLHLWLNFNQQEGLKLIEKLFDKIVIDQSTTKALEGNFTQRFSILLRTPESTLIFEDASASGIALSFMNQNSICNFDPERNSLEITYPYLKSVGRGNGENLLESGGWLRSLATAEFKKYLESIYHQVEECKNTHYPYKTNYSSPTDRHFVVGDPKVQNT